MIFPRLGRPKAKQAATELVVLRRWEEFTTWFLDHSAKWPKCIRFTLTQRLQNHALDALELLVEARYERAGRPDKLRVVNLRLERMRFLLRVAREHNVMSSRSHEGALRRIDEAGRMLHGWRLALTGAKP